MRTGGRIYMLPYTYSVVYLFVGMISCGPTYGQIVDNITGDINLQLFNFHTQEPDDEATIPAGFDAIHHSIDGAGYPFAGGNSEFYYNVLEDGPARTWFYTNTIAETLEPSYGGGGQALLDIDISVPVPFCYRLEADETEGFPYYYEVSFNEVSAYAAADPYYLDGGWAYGTFPLIYAEVSPDQFHSVGWYTYVDQGILPAGTYQFTTQAKSTLHHSSTPFNSSGVATLLIQMLGDSNLDGFIGLDDLDAVLNRWNDLVPAGQVQFGDHSLDGFVGLDDLDMVLGSWNADIRPGSSMVPEPGSALLVGMCILVWTTRRSMSSRM